MLGRLQYLENRKIEISPDLKKERANDKEHGVINVFFLAREGKIIASFEFTDTIRANT
ncbi:MAG: hypothetical protein U0525_04600 [Patescibacteria group bacterium]